MDFLYPLRCLHGRMHDRSVEKQAARKIANKIRASGESTLLFVLSPAHGNLGDHAIAKSTLQILKELEVSYLEITTRELNLLNNTHMMGCMNRHPILVNGGGNLGTLWPKVERVFREIIRKNPRSSIICLPNTIFYEDSDYGKKELAESKRIYNSHGKLKICAREKISYDFMVPIYKDVVLIPDMVLFLNESNPSAVRDGCLLCLRKDVEKTRSEADDLLIRKQAQELFGDRVWELDMVADHPVSIEERSRELDKQFDRFRKAELVITDRLHGMIFCAITGTPCIVINSKSPKVRGCYEWIKELPYIRFAETPEEIERLYDVVRGDYQYDNAPLQDYYKELKKYISDLVKQNTR